MAVTAVCVFGGHHRAQNGKLLCAGGVRDQVHLYVEPPATITIAELVGTLKSNTARWIHQTFPHRRDFKWQRGYAAFTVSGADDAAHALD